MDRDRRILIIREIEYWRRNKLLPPQYCDFLLNLYTESADQEPGAKPIRKSGKQAVADSKLLHWVLLFGIASSIFYVVLHFSSFPTELQIVIFALASLIPYGAGIFLLKKKPLPANLSIAAGTGFMLMMGAFLLKQAGWQEWQHAGIFLVCCSVFWLLFGMGVRVAWLHFCGWAGLMLSYALLLNRLSVPGGWVTLELCWLPLALLFGYVGWLLSQRAKSSGAVCLILSCLLWFMPEMYALLLTDWPGTAAQLLLLGKLAVLGALGYALRKIWIEWVV